MKSRDAGRGRRGSRSRPLGRNQAVRVGTARRRKGSSTRWLHRQLNDPYVEAAKKDSYRSRAAYKLLQLDEKFGLLKRGQTVVDLGAAPGSWTQVLAQILGPSGTILAVDVAEIEPIGGCKILMGDVMDIETETAIRKSLKGPVDLVVSDIAPSATGHRATDHIRIIALAEAALELARGVLSPGGGFVAKVWQGGSEQNLLTGLKRDFTQVRHAKPQASRTGSAEMYVVATGYRGKFQQQDSGEG